MKRRELEIKWTVHDSVQPEGMPAYGGRVNGPRDALPYLAPWASEPQEVAVILLLDARMQVIGHKEVGRGSTFSCPMDVSSVFRAAIVGGAVAIFLSHNHPSGDPYPSIDDIDVTARLVKAGSLLGIPVLDHLITALNPSGGVILYSLKENGMI